MAKDKSYEGFTAEERGAMKERAKELKTRTRRRSSANPEHGEADVLAKIAELAGPDRVKAERVHAIVTANAPDLTPKL